MHKLHLPAPTDPLAAAMGPDANAIHKSRLTYFRTPRKALLTEAITLSPRHGDSLQARSTQFALTLTNEALPRTLSPTHLLPLWALMPKRFKLASYLFSDARKGADRTTTPEPSASAKGHPHTSTSSCTHVISLCTTPSHHPSCSSLLVALYGRPPTAPVFPSLRPSLPLPQVHAGDHGTDVQDPGPVLPVHRILAQRAVPQWRQAQRHAGGQHATVVVVGERVSFVAVCARALARLQGVELSDAQVGESVRGQREWQGGNFRGRQVLCPDSAPCTLPHGCNRHTSVSVSVLSSVHALASIPALLFSLSPIPPGHCDGHAVRRPVPVHQPGAAAGGAVPRAAAPLHLQRLLLRQPAGTVRGAPGPAGEAWWWKGGMVCYASCVMGP